MNEFVEFDALRVALIDYYGNGKIGPLVDHLPVGAEMVDSRYIRYQGQTERLDQWCRRLDVYNAPKSYNVKGNYQSRVHSSKTISTPDLPKRSRRPLASCSDEELVDLAKKTANRFNKAIDEARIIGSEYTSVGRQCVEFGVCETQRTQRYGYERERRKRFTNRHRKSYSQRRIHEGNRTDQLVCQ